MKTKICRGRCPHRPATRIVSLILSLAMLLTLTVGLDFSAFAYDNDDYDERYEYYRDTVGQGESKDGNWNYKILKDGTISITADSDHNLNSNLVIPNKIDGYTVSAIGFCAFGNIDGSYFSSITIPYGIKYIDYEAFEGCSSLTEIVIPDSVTLMYYRVFEGCTNLKSITFSKNMDVIPYGAVRLCSSLETVDIPDNITKIGTGAFEGCSNLKNIKIPKTMERIYMGAFNDCPNIKNVYYLGTPTQWKAVNIRYYNDSLLNANIYCNYASVANDKFEDIQMTAFVPYSDYVMYTSVYNNFINGTNPPYFTEFSPNQSITRAMFVTILYRMAGEPYKNANLYDASPFTDIKDTSMYYYDAACWALDNDITTQTTFKPYDNVSREQTASFLFRYAKENDMLGDVAYKNVNLFVYHDYDNIRDWSKEAMQWANYNGMITGTQQGYANPQGSTLRIHATKILYGFGKVCNIGNFE